MAIAKVLACRLLSAAKLRKSIQGHPVYPCTNLTNGCAAEPLAYVRGEVIGQRRKTRSPCTCQRTSPVPRLRRLGSGTAELCAGSPSRLRGVPPAYSGVVEGWPRRDGTCTQQAGEPHRVEKQCGNRYGVHRYQMCSASTFSEERRRFRGYPRFAGPHVKVAFDITQGDQCPYSDQYCTALSHR